MLIYKIATFYSQWLLYLLWCGQLWFRPCLWCFCPAGNQVTLNQFFSILNVFNQSSLSSCLCYPPLLPAPPSDQSYIILFGRYVGGRKIVSSFKYPVTTQLSISARRKEWCIRVLVNPGGLQEVVTEVLFFNFCLFVLFTCSTFSTCHLFLLGLYIFFSEFSNLFSNGNSPVLQRLPRIFIRF